MNDPAKPANSENGTIPSTDATTNVDPDGAPTNTTPIPEDPAPSHDGGHTTVPTGG